MCSEMKMIKLLTSLCMLTITKLTYDSLRLWNVEKMIIQLKKFFSFVLSAEFIGVEIINQVIILFNAMTIYHLVSRWRELFFYKSTFCHHLKIIAMVLTIYHWEAANFFLTKLFISWDQQQWFFFFMMTKKTWEDLLFHS